MQFSCRTQQNHAGTELEASLLLIHVDYVVIVLEVALYATEEKSHKQSYLVMDPACDNTELPE